MSGRDARPGGPGEYRLSSDSARRVVDRTGPAAPPARFLSTDHLSTEAVAAYVDEMLPATGRARADTHLERCRQCRDDVEQQRQARQVLRGSGPIRMPDELRERLGRLAESGGPGGRPGEVPGTVAAPDAAEHLPPWARWTRRLRRRPR